MKLLQASVDMDITHAMQLKFEQRLDDKVKYELAHQIAQRLIESNQFIIQTQQHPSIHSKDTITFFIELYISYKKE